MTDYYRPIPMHDPARPDGAAPLAGGWGWFTHAARMTRGGETSLVPVAEIPDPVRARLVAPRGALAGLDWRAPRVMGILNVTPDSFSDGGQFLGRDAALAQARRLVAEGADILDIGGESTRPGAAEVSETEEIARTVPVIETLAPDLAVPISIDTRKAAVGRAALDAGAAMLNDVSALGYDAGMGALAAETGVPVCLMHAQGDPATMQVAPAYDDVLFDVYDYLEDRLRAAEAFGIRRENVILDVGIGFGKTLEHNLRLLRHLSLFHALGCVLMLGASRKKFIGTLGDAPDAADRVAGSVAVALEGAAQGVQILRVHDMKDTKQALRLAGAIRGERW